MVHPRPDLWGGSYLKICTHQWLDERGVAAVAPPAVRQSASEVSKDTAEPRTCNSGTVGEPRRLFDRLRYCLEPCGLRR
jgi:hypothetical protein